MTLFCRGQLSEDFPNVYGSSMSVCGDGMGPCVWVLVELLQPVRKLKLVRHGMYDDRRRGCVVDTKCKENAR